MVFFNDPVIQVDHAARAVRMAMAIRERFVGLADEWRRRGHVLRSGSGSPPATPRWAGSGSRAATTTAASGNAIILAPRLSSDAAARQILVAQRTFAAIEGLIDAEPAGERQVKGLSRPVTTYSVEVGARDRSVETAAS
jgi:class 3 adenylate cyclase